MSHFATIETQVRDVDALARACKELGLELAGQGEARGFDTNRIRGDHVIRLRGPYDVAVQRQASGTFALCTDWWGGDVEREVGKAFGRLLQVYGVHKATIEAKRKGYMVQRQTLGNGAVKLTIRGM